MFDIDGGSVPSSRTSSASGSNAPVENKKRDTPPVFSYLHQDLTGEAIAREALTSVQCYYQLKHNQRHQ